MINFDSTEKIFNSIDIPIFVRDKNNNYLFCNNAFSNLLNIPIYQIIGKNIKDIFTEEYKDLIITDDFIDNEIKKNVFEFYCRSLNKYFIIIKSFFYNLTEKLIIGCILDITDIKQRDEQITKNSHLMFLNKFERILLISGLMNNLSHQLSQPLNAIKILVDTNLKFIEHNLPVKQHLDDLYFISNQIQRLETIINNLKYIENSNSNNEITIVNIAASVYDSLELLSNELSEKNIKIETSLNNEYKIIFPKYYLEYIIGNIIRFLNQSMLNDKTISIKTSENDTKIILTFSVNSLVDFSKIYNDNTFSSHILNEDITNKIIFSTINNIFKKYQVDVIYDKFIQDNKTELKILFDKIKGTYENSVT